MAASRALYDKGTGETGYAAATQLRIMLFAQGLSGKA